MSFIKDLFIADTKSKIEFDVSLSESEKVATHSFLFTRKQWIQGKKIEHEIVGEIDTEISKQKENMFKWRVHLKNTTCKEKTNSILEFYIFWDYIQSVDFVTDKKGRILHEIETFGQDEICKEKIRKVKENNIDANRKQAILNSLKVIKKNPVYLKALFEKNPVIQLLCRNLELYNKNTTENNSVSLHTYYTKDTMLDYFGKDIHLPVKKYSSWDKRNEKNIVAACIGGIDKEFWEEEKIFKYMRNIAGKVNIGRELFLDYSEYYQYNKNDVLNTGNLEKAENYIETAVTDAWYLEEQTVLNNLKK
jgi:hypothetical protein